MDALLLRKKIWGDMQLTDAQVALLKSIVEEWNRAEEDIKIAEQVCNNVVFPSIKELRYGGRRLADALARLVAGAPQQEIDDLLADAKFDCHRARHDAVDAATSKIAIDLGIMTKKLGYEVILPVYPKFHQLYKDLNEVRTKIAASRANREDREKIYSALVATDFRALVSSYNDMMTSEPIMLEMAKKRRRSEVIGYVGFATGVVGFIALFF